MDRRSFAALARGGPDRAHRRTALKALAGGALAATFSALRANRVDARRCQRTNNKCQVDKDCCTRRCIDGHCACKPFGAACKFDGACCTGICSGTPTEQGVCTFNA